MKIISILAKVFIVIFIVFILAGISVSNVLEKYSWGNDVEKILKDIGVQSIRNVSMFGDFEDKEFYIIDADDIELKLWLNKNLDGTYDIMQISSNGKFENYPTDAIFYINDNLKTDEEGRVLYNIYDYKTGNLLLEMDKSVKAEKEEKLKEFYEKMEQNEYLELWYDDIFFGKDDITGSKVKLNLFLEEKYLFTIDDMYDTKVNEFYSENNLYRDFYKCGVLRENTDNYAGQQINLFFSNDYSLNPNDYKVGDKIIVKGEIVEYYVDKWDNCNDVFIIPHSIEFQ